MKARVKRQQTNYQTVRPTSIPLPIPSHCTTAISVIIPVLNEAAQLPTTLKAIQAATPYPTEVEIIVVDGGSSDRTVVTARDMGVRVIETSPGRAHQMNEGAKLAQGDILLFLHGDTRLPAAFADHLQQVLSQPGVVAGAFELQIDDPAWGLRWVEWGVKWRSRLGQLPYGDQGIFLAKWQFEAIGGFPDLPIMEDFVLIRRLQKLGRIAIAPAIVSTSSRRWQRLGIWQTTLWNQVIVVGYYLGIAPAQLARWYRRPSRKK